MSERDTPTGKVAEKAKTVTVACKHPSGIVLQLCEQQKLTDPGTGRDYVQSTKSGPTYTVRGFAIPRGPDFDHEKAPQLAGGYALTPGIPADFWNRWLEQNKDTDLVKNGLIFAADGTQFAADKAKERRKEYSGLEPLAQGKDPRAPSRVEKADMKTEAA